MNIMLGTHKIIVDEWAEVWDLLQPYADGSFWQWPSELDPEAVYIVGRVVLRENWAEITAHADKYPGRIVFSNPAEGSQTVLLQLKRLMIDSYVRSGKIGLLTSGNMEPGIPYCKTDCYFSNIVEYTENKAAAHVIEQPENREADRENSEPLAKPYNFLFLNGRLRPHRKWLIDRLRQEKLLDSALWSNLSSCVEMSWTSELDTGNLEPIKLLPPEYEIARARCNLDLVPHEGFIKHKLFGDTWGDAIVNPRCYTDTHFSLVTETIYDYPYTFRTEKIWKPILMAHPFIVASCTGYYEELRAAGFRTFGHLIDERFDTVDDPERRAEMIVDTVRDICYNGAGEFARAAEDVCKYNQQHLREHNRSERAQLPINLEQYLNERL